AVFAPEPWPEDFLSHGGGALGLRPKGFITASADMTAVPGAIVPQVARYAEELKTPGGVLYGAKDHVLDPKVHGEPMAAFGLDYEALAGKGHMIPMTEPEACADFIRRMAAKARPSSAAAE
ncbi:MAG: alpha/beta hydrolase, partial [Pseudomonadota bacterium]